MKLSEALYAVLILKSTIYIDALCNTYIYIQSFPQVDGHKHADLCQDVKHPLLLHWGLIKLACNLLACYSFVCERKSAGETLW